MCRPVIDADQMRHASGPKHIPVHPVYGGLVAHHQRRHQAGRLVRLHMRQDAFAHTLAQQRHRVPAGLAQALRRRIGGAATHVGTGLHTALPQPELVVKTKGVAAAMRCLQAQRQAPALAGPHLTGLALRVPALAAKGKSTGIPADIDACRHCCGAPVQRGRFGRQGEAQTGLIALRHFADHAHDAQVAPLQRRLQGLGIKGQAAQASRGKTQGGGAQQPGRQTTWQHTPAQGQGP